MTLQHLIDYAKRFKKDPTNVILCVDSGNGAIIGGTDDYDLKHYLFLTDVDEAETWIDPLTGKEQTENEQAD